MFGIGIRINGESPESEFAKGLNEFIAQQVEARLRLLIPENYQEQLMKCGQEITRLEKENAQLELNARRLFTALSEIRDDCKRTLLEFKR